MRKPEQNGVVQVNLMHQQKPGAQIIKNLELLWMQALNRPLLESLLKQTLYKINGLKPSSLNILLIIKLSPSSAIN
jgi:hypothetical protein